MANPPWKTTLDGSPELEANLAAKNKTALLEITRAVSKLARVTYTRQAEPLGLGHAVLRLKSSSATNPSPSFFPTTSSTPQFPA